MRIDSCLDRTEAFRDLTERLVDSAGRPDAPVLALPSGGVPVAHEVARVLGTPLDGFHVLVRKWDVPGHEEPALNALATGAVVSRGVGPKGIGPGFRISSSSSIGPARTCRPRGNVSWKGRNVCLRTRGGQRGHARLAANRRPSQRRRRTVPCPPSGTGDVIRGREMKSWQPNRTFR